MIICLPVNETRVYNAFKRIVQYIIEQFGCNIATRLVTFVGTKADLQPPYSMSKLKVEEAKFKTNATEMIEGFNHD